MIKYRDETNGLNTKVTFVPHILINGHHINHLDFQEVFITLEHSEKQIICLVNESNNAIYYPPSTKMVMAISLLSSIISVL